MQLLYVFYFLCSFVTNLWSKSLPKEKENLVINCIKAQRHSSSFPIDKKCQKLQERYFKVVTSTNSSAGLSRLLFDSYGYNVEMISYMTELLRWKPQEKDSAIQMLNNVASCHPYSKPYRKYWKQFFLKRQDTMFSSVKVYTQTWNSTKGQITFRPSVSRYATENIVAAELILTRVSPNSIGELYGRYKSKVMLNASLDQPSKIVHSDSQSACFSEHGNLMLLDLKVEEVIRWHRNRTQNITLNVNLLPQRQYFNSTQRQWKNVIKKIEGVIVHFRLSKEEKERDDLHNQERLLKAVEMHKKSIFNSKKKNFYASKILRKNVNTLKESRARFRRSPGRTLRIDFSPTRSTSCHLTSFVIHRRLLEKTYKIVSEEEHFDIKECAGKCLYPISSHLTPPNHAIATHSKHGRNGISSMPCCVPVQYEALIFLALENDEINRVKMRDMKATRCGCR